MRRPLLFWCVAILAALYCAILLGAGDLVRTDLTEYAGEEVRLTGRVVSVTRYETHTRVVLRASGVERDTESGGATNGTGSGTTKSADDSANGINHGAANGTDPAGIAEARDDRLRSVRETVLLSLSGDFPFRRLAGAEVTVWTTLRLPAGKRNPGGFDYAMYLRGKRICVTGSGPAAFLHKTGRRFPLLGLAANMRETFAEWLSGRTDRETASLLVAMVLGDRSLLSDETENDFRRSGLSHLMAVSGLHVTLLFAWLSRTSRAPKGKGAVLRSLALLGLYGWLCSFSPSVVRGILMIVFRKIADLLHRHYDMLTAIGFSALLSALVNPFSIVQTGFLLSYGAVLALALILPAIEAKTEAKLRLAMAVPKRVFWETARLTGASVSIAIGMAPLQLLLFRQLTPAAIVLNVPAIALAGIVMPVGFVLFVFANIASLFSGVPGSGSVFAAGQAFCAGNTAFPDGLRAIGDAAAAVPLFLERILIALLRLLAAVGSFFSVRAPGVSTVFVALVSGGGIFALGEWFRMNRERSRRRVAVACLVTLFVTGTLGILADDSIGRSALVFVDVGQGDCLHIHERAFVRSASDGESRGGIGFSSVDFLIDGGGSAGSNTGESMLLPYLLSQGVTRLDGVLATHLHIDHFKGLAEICREVDVGGFVVFSGYRPREEEIVTATGLGPDRIVYVAAGDTVTLSPDVSLEVLWPEEPVWANAERTVLAEPDRYADENESSIVVRVNFHGVSCLMTADLSAEGEESLLAYAEARAGKAERAEGHSTEDPATEAGAAKHTGGAAKRYLGADILKVAHHGSRFSSTDAFLAAVSPKAAVIQVGAYNSYGHPAPATLEKLGCHGIMVYRNDRQGAVIVTPGRSGFRVRTMRRDGDVSRKGRDGNETEGRARWGGGAEAM